MQTNLNSKELFLLQFLYFLKSNCVTTRSLLILSAKYKIGYAGTNRYCQCPVFGY
jgi:hypothetical protein